MTDEELQEKLNTALYKKMFAEQEQYRDWLLSQNPAEVLNHAYEYTVREDILIALEYFSISANQAAALLSSPSPLSDVFTAFEKTETDHMDNIRDCICQRADDTIRDLQPPVYPHSAAYAAEHDELDAYRESLRANMACKSAIEEAISESYRDNRLDEDGARRILKLFGSERTMYVLASTIQMKHWDERISAENKSWAQTVSFDEGTEDDRFSFLIGRSHPGLIDLFANQVRRIEKESQAKTSLLGRLKTAQEEVRKQQPASHTRKQENVL